MSSNLSISLEKVPHLPQISDSCTFISQFKSSAITEITDNTFGVVVDAIVRENLFATDMSKLSLTGSIAAVIGAIAIPFKWYKDCSEKLETEQQLTKTVAEKLKINQAAVECHSQTCFIVESSRKKIPKNLLIKEELAKSIGAQSTELVVRKKELEEALNHETTIDIRKVDVFPDKQTIPFLTQNLVTGFGVGFFSVGLLTVTAATATVALSILSAPITSIPLIIGVTFMGYGAVGHLITSKFLLPITSLMIKTGFLGSAIALAQNGQNLVKIHYVNKDLSKIVAQETKTFPEAIQCDVINGVCYNKQIPKEKKITVIGPMAKKTKEAHTSFKGFEHHSIKEEIKASIKQTGVLAEQFQKSISTIKQLAKNILRRWF